MSAHLPGYTATVKRNGTPIEFVEATYIQSADNVAPAWEIKLPYPLDIDADDTWSISRGYGGMDQTIVDGEVAAKVAGSEGIRSYSRVISGEGDGQGDSVTISELMEYCVPKTLVFVNYAWLQSIAPTAVIRDNIIKLASPFSHSGDENLERFYHPRLPGKDVADDEFICIVGPTTHHAIGKYLAGLVTCGIVINVPDITLINTYTVPAGTRWFDAIKQNFLIWGPNVQLVEDTIYILDITPEAEIPADLQTVSIDKPAILSITSSMGDDTTAGGTAGDIVDHVIVTGRVTTNTTSYYAEPVEFEIVEVPEVPLDENESVVYGEKMARMDEKKEMASYTGNFEEGDDEYTVSAMSYNLHYEFYHVYYVGLQRKKKRKLVREIIESYKDGEGLKSRVTTTHRFGPGKRPIGSSTQEEGYVRYPGKTDPYWCTYKWHHIFQNRFARGVNRALSSELVEGLVLYELSDSGEKLSPISLADANRMDKSRTLVEKDGATSQAVLEMTINTKTTKIDRIDDDTLVQRIFDYDVLADDLKVNRQIIENPLRDELQENSEEEIFRAEFHDGNGQMVGGYGPCYHAPLTVHHDDIDTQSIAQQIADRIFARKGPTAVGGSPVTTITIKTPVPIPFTTMSCLVELPSRGYTVDGSPVTIPGGTYVLRSVKERITPQGTEQVIVVRSDF